MRIETTGVGMLVGVKVDTVVERGVIVGLAVGVSVWAGKPVASGTTLG